MKNLKHAIFASILVIFSIILPAAAETKQPTIMEATLFKADYGDQLLINGLAPKNAEILIYINNFYSGFANIKNNDPDLNNFSYLSPVIKGVKDNNYTILAVARNISDYTLSSPSESKITSVIKQSYLENNNKKQLVVIKTKNPSTENQPIIPAPKLINPKGNIGEYKPIISGFSINKTFVTLFIDDVLETTLWINDNALTATSTIAFDYLPNKNLSKGAHSVYAFARDNNGQKSENSNTLYFLIDDLGVLATSSVSYENESSDNLSNDQIINTPSSSNKTFSKNNLLSQALNISLLVLFIAGVAVWVITTRAQTKNDLKNKK